MWNSVFAFLGATSLLSSHYGYTNFAEVTQAEWAASLSMWNIPTITSCLYLNLMCVSQVKISGRTLGSAMYCYNLTQVIFNTWLALQFVMLVYQDKEQPWIGDSNAKWNPRLGYLFWLYYVNKIVDLSDTAFLVLKGKRLSMLHTVHHLGQVWFCHFVLNTFPRGDTWIPCALNSAVHAIMYAWYLKPSRKMKRFVTALQMSQLALLAAHNVYVGFVVNTVPSILATVSLFWMLLLLALFAAFSAKTYAEDNNEQSQLASALILKHQLRSWGSQFLTTDTAAAHLMWVANIADVKKICSTLEGRGMIFLGMGYAKGWWKIPPNSPSSCDDVLYEVSKRTYGNLRAFYNRIPMTTGLKFWWQGRNRGVKPGRSIRDRAASDHYNLSSSILWDTILDPETKTYTCGVYSSDSLDLGCAQLAKVDFYIDNIMGLKDMTDEERSNYSVLDVGAGWGSIVNRLSDKYPTVKVSGLTHSPVQVKEYHPNVNAIVADMLDHEYAENAYDCIIMIEVEHVGRDNYPALMKKIRKALKSNGIYVMQSLNTPKTYQFFLDEFIDKYIFPGGYLPSVSLLASAAEFGGLKLISDHEWDTVHYEITFENWRRRFSSNFDAIQESIGSEAARAFRIYLAFTQFTLEAGGFAPHTMIFNKRGQPGAAKLYPNGVPQVSSVKVPDEKLSQWLSSRRSYS